MQKLHNSVYARHLAIILGYGLLAIVMTWPLAQHFTTHIPGDGVDDPALAWNLWWVRKSLLDLHQNPFQTDYMFYPLGLNLIWYTLTLLNGIVSLPLQVFGIITANNILVLLTYALSGYSAYLLMRQLLVWSGLNEPGLSQAIPILAGIGYAFPSERYFYTSVGQVNIISGEFMPLYVLFFLKLAHERAHRIRNALLAALFLLLTGYVEFTFASFLAILSALYVAYVVISGEKPFGRRECKDEQVEIVATAENTPIRADRGWWLSMALVVVAFVIGFAPILYAMLSDIIKEGDISVEGWGFADVFSADLTSFFLPSPAHPLFGGLFRQLAGDYPNFRFQNYFYLGWSAIILAVIGLRRYWKQLRFWLLGAVSFLLLSMGPVLHIFGQSRFNADGLLFSIPLPPFIILHYLPLFRAQRTPNRFSVLLALFVAVLMAYGAAVLLKRVRGTTLRNVLACIIAVVFLFEHLNVPIALTDFGTTPYVYTQVAQAAARQPGTVLTLPLAWRNGFIMMGPEDLEVMRVQFWQTVHQQPLIGGNTSRNTEWTWQYFLHAPLLRSLIALQTGGTLSQEQEAIDKQMLGDVLRLDNIRYVVVHPGGRTYPGNPNVYHYVNSPAHKYLESLLPLKPLAERDGYIAYTVEIPPAPPSLQIDMGTEPASLYRGEGWGEPQHDAGGTTELLMDHQDAQILVPLQGHTAQHMTLRLRAPETGQQIAVDLNGTPMGTIKLTQEWGEYALDIPASAVLDGRNVLNLHASQLYPLASLRNQESYAIGTTGVTAPVNIQVSSAGTLAGNHAHLYVNGQNVSPERRGYNIAVLDQTSGAVLQTAHFDTYLDESESAKLAAFIKAIPDGRIVLAAIRDEGSSKLTPEAVDALHSIGAASDLRGKFRMAHAIIGVKGALPGSALEATQTQIPAVLATGASSGRSSVALAVDWIHFANR